MIEWDCFCLQILVFSSLSSALFSSFALYDQYISVETIFLCIIQPPLEGIMKVFLCIFHHLQFSFANSSLIKLSSFDLKVLQLSFSVKKKSVVKSSSFRYSITLFPLYLILKLLVFQVSKAVLNSKSQSVVLVFLSFWKEKIVSTVALKENSSDMYLFFFLSFSH